jgi:5-methylcytosine-specific restriction endonuclease McrA
MSKKVFQKWTEEEIVILQERYNNSYDDLQKLFPHRTLKSIKHKITNMNLPRKLEYERYSKEEDEIIKSNSHLTVSEIQELLPNRKVDSILQRYRYLGLEWKKTWEFWTEEEISLLEITDHIEELLTLLPGRTEESIRIKANRLGKQFNEYWTDEELKILINNYGKLQVNEFVHLLPNRNESSIYTKANSLGLKGLMGRYDISDEDIITLFNEGMYPSQIAKELNLTPNTIASRLRRNGIDFEPTVLTGENNPNWNPNITDEERINNRKYPEYQQWRLSVYERDNYTCQCCFSKKGGNLVAHHILNYSTHHDLRTDLANGLTLCEDCHVGFHNLYGYKNNTKEQLDEYITNYTNVETKG